MSTPAWETRRLLFVYGTLLAPTGFPAVDAAMASGLDLGPAHMHGWLYDLGEYPGVKPFVEGAGWAWPEAVADLGAGASAGTATRPGAGAAQRPEAGPAPKVWGRLVGFPDPEAAFAALDWYEGSDPASPHAGEFARAITKIFLSDPARAFDAQVYLYTLPAEGRPRIESGDYLSYRRSRKEKP